MEQHLRAGSCRRNSSKQQYVLPWRFFPDMQDEAVISLPNRPKVSNPELRGHELENHAFGRQTLQHVVAAFSLGEEAVALRAQARLFFLSKGIQVQTLITAVWAPLFQNFVGQ